MSKVKQQMLEEYEMEIIESRLLDHCADGFEQEYAIPEYGDHVGITFGDIKKLINYLRKTNDKKD